MKGPRPERGTRRTDATVGPQPSPRTGKHDQNYKAVVQSPTCDADEKSRPGERSDSLVMRRSGVRLPKAAPRNQQVRRSCQAASISTIFPPRNPSRREAPADNVFGQTGMPCWLPLTRCSNGHPRAGCSPLSSSGSRSAGRNPALELCGGTGFKIGHGAVRGANWSTTEKIETPVVAGPVSGDAG